MYCFVMLQCYDLPVGEIKNEWMNLLQSKISSLTNLNKLVGPT